MAFNPFKSKPPVDKPSRNAFDLSFANNLTMEFGKLYPVFCKECIPGDTFRIKPTFGFRMMPMYFPVQSRMRADLKFFYVRNRNLWADWKKFIGQTDTDVVPPYLKIDSDKAYRLATKSLLDYLGVPTTVVNDVGASQTMGFSDLQNISSMQNNLEVVPGFFENYVDFTKIAPNTLNWFNFVSEPNESQQEDYSFLRSVTSGYAMIGTTPISGRITYDTKIELFTADAAQFSANNLALALFEKKLRPGVDENAEVPDRIKYKYEFQFSTYRSVNLVSSTNESVTVSFPDGKLVGRYRELELEDFFDNFNYQSKQLCLAVFVLPGDSGDLPIKTTQTLPSYMSITQLQALEEFDAATIDNPFIDYGDGAQIGLSALPCRAYEAIYNSFYRNVEVDPFRINRTNPSLPPTSADKPEYDKFIPVDTGGADTFEYDFHYANWEQDFLTTSLPSPQQGIAPLVGGRPADTTMYELKTVDGAYKVYATNNDAQTILGLVGYSNSEEVSQVSSDGSVTTVKTPQSAISALEEAITYGISINDFRNVNALQKWLEKNIRRGYRYKDQILSHFGVSLTYEECDMPEYIGGISEDVNVRAVTQTTGTADSPLGSYAGQAGVSGSSKHEIDKYTDEHGFIIGILCITPIPTYSQLLPKHFLKMSPLDYFTPEFGHIGMQPISYKEVCPIQAFNEAINLEDTFGYQRAFYDYLASVDELHGDFRGNLKDFLVDRVFGSTPRLNRAFLQVDPEQINDVFNVTSADDKILGQIWFDVTCVRPIPKYGVPRLD